MLLMTYATRLTLAMLLRQRGKPCYGQQVIKETGVRGGTVYPLLARLERDGYVGSEDENGDPRRLGRPLRRYYKLTPAGVKLAKSPKAQRTTPAI